MAIPEHTLGLGYLKTGDYEKAVAFLEQGAELAPQHQNIEGDLNRARQKLRAAMSK